MATPIYKICPRALWQEAERDGLFPGSPADEADGYIHLSTAEQVGDTAAKHFRGQDDLVLVAVDAEALGEALRWEPARGGALFPHLYGPLPVAATLWAKPLETGPEGGPVVPRLDP
ncbi:MAG TPA: DUF952 domain-containing protein [Afifellaceae bacterium]|nr:DUF952 domain-containing protein [Afifellaceae bacterium]